ncbi:MAG: hypothetical protein JWN72_1970, partial [Thermoleophilia bacterium]|nr:hypothetical protein [Thermoleophilia bacterium]
TNRFTALAVKTTPLAIVYRGDSVRDQLLRLVRDDPSSLELARWFATMSVVSASRDGWVGVAPPIDRSRRAVRLVGAFEWSKGQSQIGEPTPVKRVVLDELPASTSVAVAVDDPGSYVEDFLGAATRRGYNFATKLDVPKGEPHVNALKLLGQLDGPSAMSLTATGRVSARIHVRSSRKAVAQVEAAARLFGLEDALEVTAVTQGQVEIAYEAAPLATAKGSVLRNEGGEAAAGVTDPTRSEESDAVTSTATLGTDPTFTSAFQAAGAPPRLPVAWFYSRTSCVEEEAIAGWLTWDKDKRMTWALDVPLGDPTLVTRCALRAAVGIDAARHDPGADGASTGPMTSAEMQAQLPSTNAMIALIARLRGPSADQIGSPVDVTIQ